MHITRSRLAVHECSGERVLLPATRRLRSGVRILAAKSSSRTDSLRELLKQPTILKGPCCHDALSARLIERAGFDFAFMSGFCTAGARLGAPDTGLISYYEMVDQGRYIHEATKQIPIIGDGDTGYGNAMNVKRTVRGYAAAGFAGILIEDQLAPKSCGHVRNKRVTTREEAVSRIRAAVDARDEGADILILARSDARQAESLDEALWRAAAFADAGADMLFIDALASEEEMRKFCNLGGAAAGLPKMANMLEGGGKTPILPPEELQAMGFKLVAYPLSLLGVSIRAMEQALMGLKHGQVPDVRDMGTFVDIQMAVGFPEYYEEEARYAISTPSSTSSSTSSGPPVVPGFTPADSTKDTSPDAAGGVSAAETAGSASAAPAADTAAVSQSQNVVQEQQQQQQQQQGQQQRQPFSVVVEPDEVVPPSDSSSSMAVQQFGSTGQEQRDSGWDAFRRSKFFRITIRDKRTGTVKLETRIPAGFIGATASIIPQIAGINFDEFIEGAMGGKLDLSKPLLDYEIDNDVITIYLELQQPGEGKEYEA